MSSFGGDDIFTTEVTTVDDSILNMHEIPEENQWGEPSVLDQYEVQGTENPLSSSPPSSTPSSSSPSSSSSFEQKREDSFKSGANQGMTPVSMAGLREPEESHFEFRVIDPKKSGEGMSAYAVYTVVCKSTAPGLIHLIFCFHHFCFLFWLFWFFFFLFFFSFLFSGGMFF